MAGSSRSNRREFLQGQAAAKAVGEWIAPADEPHAAAPAETYLLRLGRRAMACQFEVFFNAGQHAAASELALEAFDLIDRLEEQMTVFRDTSEICRVNRFAADRPVELEPRLFQLLARAGELHRETEGAFDVTSGPLTKAWGFSRRAGAVPAERDIAEALARVGGGGLELDEATQTARFLRSGMELNLGAIGKGHALDRAAELLLASGIDHFLWHGGQSSVLARGACGPAAPGEGWLVDLKHPLRPERGAVEIRLRDRALGTSGAGTQFFRHAGRRYGHIIDPRTGWPAEGVFSTTVLAASAADADALATALYVLGPQRAADWCARHPDVGVLMFVPGNGPQAVELLTFNLADDDWRVTDGWQPPAKAGGKHQEAG